MKILYFDCKNGISGDMLLKALMELSADKERIAEAIANEKLHDGSSHKHSHDGNSHEHSHDGADSHHDGAHSHSHGRSWLSVRRLIEHSGFSQAAKTTALNIYQNIAVAEAEVHGESLDTIHFHEVGRDEAIKNALGTGMALEAIGADSVMVSPVYDGKGTVVCSHGDIPVPVPAVMALRKRCTYDFRQADVNMEMVTPSGLAGLMGIGATPADMELSKLLSDGELIAETEVRGSRNTGRDGLKVYLIKK